LISALHSGLTTEEAVEYALRQYFKWLKDAADELCADSSSRYRILAATNPHYLGADERDRDIDKFFDYYWKWVDEFFPGHQAVPVLFLSSVPPEPQLIIDPVALRGGSHLVNSEIGNAIKRKLDAVYARQRGPPPGELAAMLENLEYQKADLDYKDYIARGLYITLHGLNMTKCSHRG
jgi:hypothetical protein